MRATTASAAVLTACLIVAAPASAAVTAAAGLHADNYNGHIVIARDDGSHKRVLGAGDYSAISPDGKLVAVIDAVPYYPPSTPPVFKLYRAAGGAPLLTMPADGLGALTWSPDSRTLVTTDATAGRLLSIDAATGARTPLATGSFDGASFSPDSKRLAYAQGGALKIMDLATHATRTLRRHAGRPVWGQRAIAFGVSSRRHGRTLWNIATVRPNGTHLKRLTHIHPTLLYFGLVPIAWSANGRRLATNVIGSEGYWLNAYGVDALHGGARLIAGHVIETGFSRDGRYIIGQTGDAECCGFQYTNVVRIAWRTGKRKVLVRHAMNASYNG
jgi:Tol biopolymer transport system component